MSIEQSQAVLVTHEIQHWALKTKKERKKDFGWYAGQGAFLCRDTISVLKTNCDSGREKHKV